MAIENTNNSHDIRFAYWVPNVSGGLVVSNIEQRTEWNIDYNRRLAQVAEKSGFDYALSQIRFTAGYGADNQHESVSLIHVRQMKLRWLNEFNRLRHNNSAF
jgi:FMNH2-dependent dimethyl sulfone monooxygenase